MAMYGLPVWANNGIYVSYKAIRLIIKYRTMLNYMLAACSNTNKMAT
jgi:hypothetical protein